MEVKQLTDASFETEVGKAKMPVVVDFWASWCGPCQMLSPVVEAAAEKVPGVQVMKCNVDENMALAQRFGIDSIPALLRFENGEVTSRSIGYRPEAEILAFLQGNG